MAQIRTAKIFKNGASQAVRLPAEFRFEGDEVFVTRDEVTGDVTLSTRPCASAWGSFFEMLHRVDVTAGFMAERPMNVVPAASGIFDEDASATSPRRR